MERVNNMPPQEELEERVNNMPTSEDMPTPEEEFARLSNLRAIHQEVFGIVEGYRTQNQNKDFRYAVRQRNKNNRLTYGLIFKGNEDYIEIGLSGEDDQKNKTRTIYLSVNLNNRRISFHVVCRKNDQETDQIYQERRQRYEQICNKLNELGFQLKQNGQTQEINASSDVDPLDNLNATLSNWFDANYKKLYGIMYRNGILISKDDFKDMINKQVDRGILVENNGQISINEKYQPNFNPAEKDITTNPGDQNNKPAATENKDVAHTQVTNIDKPRNLIYFGAPGTGKSYNLNQALKNFRENFERVTFYPTYSYAQFVGTYKPVMKSVSAGKEEISYEFVPGPFLRVLVQALKNQGANYCLVIEEINRANAAAVFGDVFQLLDRDTNGISEYKIATSEDVKKYLFKILGKESFNLLFSKNPEQINITQENLETISISLYIPQNMYIWATMNSADQGVFPMDTAFKRRWSFEYIGIDDGVTDKCECKGWVIEGPNINWNVFRKFVNGLLSSFDVNEDKLMGPYFVKADNGTHISENSFASKVLMYLWEDAARMFRKNIFGAEIKTYSQLVLKWNSNDRNSNNIHIFDNCSDKWRNNNDLSTLYNNIITQQNAQTNTQAEGVIPVDNNNNNNIAGNTN